MGDYSLDDLNAAVDVVWDFEVSGGLVSALDAAAKVVDGMVAPRNSRKTSCGEHFEGFYAELWAFNVETANRDASLLGARLREVAQGVRDLEVDARAEQERIDAAREWRERRDARSFFDRAVDAVDFLNLFGGDEAPPRMDPVPQLVKVYESPAREGRQDFVGSKETGVSSALPDDLREFTKGERAATDEVRDTPAALRGLVTDFREKCLWGQLNCDAVLAGFSAYITSNDTDCRRLDVVADNFEAAGGTGVVSSVSNDAIAESLAVNGVSEKRPELEIPVVEAIGNPPTSGYANDPVNTATGNFVVNEEDLRCEGAAALLGWVRSYSSLSDRVGGHGPGWASFDVCGLQITGEGVSWVLVDGREVFFPRLGGGFDRAAHENYWLTLDVDGYTVSNNAGARWCFSRAGRPTSFTLTDGAALAFSHDDQGRLVRVRHGRGRELQLVWVGDRITAVELDDGRRVTYRYDNGRLVEATGPLGTRRYEWDDRGLIVSVVDADGVVEARNTYDDEGRVISQVSPFGRVTRFAYLPGRVTAVSDVDGGRSNTWLADARGRVVGVTDSDGNRSSMGYDQWGNQVLATDPEGEVTVRQFDERGRLTLEQAPPGARTSLVYDDVDRLTEIISLEDGVEVSRTSMSYTDWQQQPSVVVDGEGGHTRLRWQDGLLLEVVDPTGVRMRFEYDAHGDLVASIDAEGNVTRLVRDPAGRVVEMIRPSGATTRYEYSPAGLLTARVDPDGAVWRYTYSAGGRLTGLVDPLGAHTTLEYGPHGELAALTDALGRRVEQTFDDLGNIHQIRLPDGARWEFTHDAMSRLRQTIDPSGGVWQRHVDHYGRLNETVDPSGVRQHWRYDTKAREITTGDASSTSTTQLDRWGRHVATILPDGSTTHTRFDRCGRPVEYTDAVGGRIVVERDLAGRPVRVRRPSGASIRYTYDLCGRVAGIRNELGLHTTLTYDVDSHLIGESWATGEQGWSRYDPCGRITARYSPGVGSFRWVYDKAGRVIETRDPKNGHRRFHYDAAGQLTTAISGNGGVTRYSYDLNGRAVTVTDPLGAVSRHVFDPMDRCLSTTNPLGHTTTWGYDPAGRLTHSTDPDGHVVETSYDDAGLEASTTVDGVLFSHITRDAATRQVTIEDHSDPATPITHTLTYDPRGLLERHDRGGHTTRWSHDPDGWTSHITAPNGTTTRYRRDPAGNIIEVSHPGITTALLDRDHAGRLTRATLGNTTHEWGHTGGFITHHTATTEAGHVTTTVMTHTQDGHLATLTINGEQTCYRYDDAAQLIEATTPTGINTWTYDLAGRLTHEEIDGITWERVYNAAGEILQTTNTTTSAAISYTHDHTGRRTQETHTNGHRLEYTWTGLSRLAAITEHRNDQVKHTTTTVDALGHLSRINDLNVVTDPTTGQLLQAGNHNIITAGPLTATTNHDWIQPTWRPHRHTHPHNPYQPPPAQTTLASGTLRIGPAGELHITGLEWLGARILDPTSRAFLTPDPLPPTTAAGWSGNPYSYAGNNPTNLYDPTGLHPITTDELDAYRKHNSPKWGTALAITVGVGLAIFGGPIGIGAAIALGAGLSAGGNLIDQATSGYPINWKQVGLSGALGALGGGLGSAAGSLLGPIASQTFTRLSATPLGQRTLQAGIGGTAGGITGFITGGIGAATTGGNFWQGAWQGARDGAISGAAGGALAKPTPPKPTPSTEPVRPWGERILEVQAKLPSNWGPGIPNKKGVGTRWFDPTAPKANGIRADQGWPEAHFQTQQVDHVIVRSGGKVIGPDGNPIPGRIDDNWEAHIPLDDWLGWTTWDKP